MTANASAARKRLSPQKGGARRSRIGANVKRRTHLGPLTESPVPAMSPVPV